MLYKEPSTLSGCVRVVFEIPASIRANLVYLVGDFNNWDTAAIPFQALANGIWRVALDLPARRRYEFRYLIDGQWWTDTHADGCTLGGHNGNSILFTTLPVEKLVSSTGHGMVHEETHNHRLDFSHRPHM